MSTFAEKQLMKYGWKKGEGLGKDGGGITRPISVAVKNDVKGVGHGSYNWDFQWWDHAFNKAAMNISVAKDDDGDIKIGKEECDDSGSNQKTYDVNLTDEQLLKICEGRTGHKGARASGKFNIKKFEKKKLKNKKKKRVTEDSN